MELWNGDIIIKMFLKCIQEKARVYDVEKKSNGKILAKAGGGWTAIVDTISLNVYVAGPYGKYSNTNCIILN
jgi:hypothetical protein